MNAPDPPLDTQVLPFGRQAIAVAARLIAQGQPVAMPTETVYGLAADATDPDAVARIYQAKGRPDFNPLIVHVSDLAQAETIGQFSEAARAAALAYWPGALTLVVPHRDSSGIASAVTAGLATIALRAPDHPAMQALLAASGKPLAAPSANPSGALSPTRCDHVVQALWGKVALVIDGGPSQCGIESTIIGFASDGVRLLRPGPVAFEDVAALASLAQSPAGPGIEAPGQLASHYAPTKTLRLDAVSAEPDEWLIGFGKIAGDDNLSRAGNLVEAAAKLFHTLHRAEAARKPRIAVASIPLDGIGRAINDRLQRAAAPRG